MTATLSGRGDQRPLPSLATPRSLSERDLLMVLIGIRLACVVFGRRFPA